MEEKLAPVILFVYNRPWHTKQTLEALAKNVLADQSALYIFADGPKEDASQETLQKINETREIIRSSRWCKEVIIYEKEKNLGLADSIIAGVTEVVNKHGKIIVLEDDLITAKSFLSYMNKSLDTYEMNQQIMQVSGFIHKIDKLAARNIAIALPFTTSWGWSTWKRAWDYFDPNATGYEKLKSDISFSYKFNLNGVYPFTQMLIDQMENKNIDSWAIRWWWSVFKNKGYVVYPDKSLVSNRGFDENATHTKIDLTKKDYLFDPNYSIVTFQKFKKYNSYYYHLYRKELKQNDQSKKKTQKLLTFCKKILKSIIQNLNVKSN